jgi:glucose-1-phosphate thymidylyltransferase
MKMRTKGVVVVAPALMPMGDDGRRAIERIANRPIVCHALETLATIGVAEIAVVAPPPTIGAVRPCLERESTAVPQLRFLPQTGRPDLLGALSIAAAFVGDDAAVVHSADGLLGDGADDLAALLDTDFSDLMLLLHRSPDRNEGLTPAAERVLRIAELGGAAPPRLALTGVSLFAPGALKAAVHAAAGLAPEPDVVAIAEALAAAGGRVEASIVREWHRYDGDPHDLLELNRIVLDRQAGRWEPRDRGANRIEGRVVIDPSAEVTDSIILGPCIIGAGARVANSYIGPYTSIGAGAEIEGAEIVRSIVAENVRILHVSGRIEGSTIGRGANIFRDFGLPRAMRLHVGADVEVALN